MTEKRPRDEAVAAVAAELPVAPPQGSDLIREGDYVILYASADSITAHTVTRGRSHQSQYGEFLFDELVGHPYGQRFFSSRGLTGYVYPLRATPELLTSGGLAHRTQLVHSSDVSYITFALELRAGHTVVEAGTGSGSLTTALARLVGDAGRVFTFEFHEERAQQAREAFAAIGCARRVTVTHRDVCAGGFLVEGALGAGAADAVFLDLPSPWTAVGHALAALRPGGVLACYSPCLEQVARTCEAARTAGLQDVRTVEVRQHPWEADVRSRAEWSFDPAAVAAPVAAAAAPGEKKTKKAKQPKVKRVDMRSEDALVLLKPRAGETPGHTAFLTFCRKKA
jgi:tRNA (adenine57-N1/adenine58-N1)-methyltransferase